MSKHRQSRAENGLDELDRRILIELQEDGRRSYSEIGQSLGVSAGTARARALQLMEEGMVEIVAHPNPWRMGFQFFALVGLEVDEGDAEAVADMLTPLEEITWVAMGATGFDVLIEVAMEDADAFGRYKNQYLAKLPGVSRIEVFMLWDVRKVRYHLRVPQSRHG